MQGVSASLVYPCATSDSDVQKVIRDTLRVRRHIQSLELQLRVAMHSDDTLSQYLLQHHGVEV